MLSKYHKECYRYTLVDRNQPRPVAERIVDGYLVQVYHWAEGHPDDKLVYRVLTQRTKDGPYRYQLQCWTHADERHFPKCAARVGTTMIARLQAGWQVEDEPIQEQLRLAF